MAESNWSIRYEQQNERSRWYSSQLWYVPFAYLALVGIGLEKVQVFNEPLRGYAFFSLAVFSFAMFVHLCHLKFYERRAVHGLQLLEKEAGNPVVSSGASPWYLSFIPYIKSLFALITYIFLVLGTGSATLPSSAQLQCTIRVLSLVVATFLFALVLWKDRQRNLELTAEIRKAAAF
jgi:hypothetical protein